MMKLKKWMSIIMAAVFIYNSDISIAFAEISDLQMESSEYTDDLFGFPLAAEVGSENYVIGGGKLPEELQSFSNIDTTLIPKAHGTSKTTFLNLLQEGNFQLTIYYNNILYVLIYSPEYKLLSSTSNNK